MSVFSFGREVIAKVSISIHELLAVARESEGVKAVFSVEADREV